MPQTHLSCRCGAVTLHVTGPPILTAECCCADCRTAAEALQARPGAPTMLTGYGATPFVLFRKDRVALDTGAEHLREHRLTPDSSTRRVVAACCNTPLFLEFQKGHWLSLYAALWPDATRPAMQTRTMTRDAPDRAALPGDLPNPATHTAGFMVKLLASWVAMGFRSPKIPYGTGGLDNG